MLTRLKLFFVLLLLIPISVSAAGLGRIKVKSALGEPLSAEIELIESSSEESASLNAHIANAQDYAASGLPDAYIPPGIKVQVVRRIDNSRILQISSDRPINEPFLELLIKAETSTTNVLRQYTLLLDPPASRFSDDDAKPATEAKPKAASRNAVATDLALSDEPVPEYVPRKSRKSSRHKAKKSQDTAVTYDANKVSPAPELTADSYTTQSGDVFGKVAQRYQPEGVSLKKVMAAFYAANPDAFVNGDMNQLKAGQTLRIPTQEAMSGKPASPKEPAAPAPIKTKEQNMAVAKPDAPPKFVLKISPGDIDSDAQARADHPDAPVNNSPAASSAPGSSISGSTAPVDPSAPATNPQAPATPDATTVNPDAPVAETPPVAEAPPPAASPATPPQAEKPLLVQSTVDNKSFLDNLLANLQWIAIGMVIPMLVWLAVFILNKRRLKAMRELQQSIFEEEEKMDRADREREELYGTAAGLGEVSAYQAPAIVKPVMEKPVVEKDSIPAPDLYNAPGYGAFSAPDSEMDIHEVDPLVEAEIYMSYGRDEQAETILVNALAKTPHKHEISLGLLRIYAERGDKVAFERVAHTVYEAAERGGIDDVIIWGKAAILGLKLDPENALYQIERVEDASFQAFDQVEDQALQPIESPDSDTLDPFESMTPMEPLAELDELSDESDAALPEEDNKPQAMSSADFSLEPPELAVKSSNTTSFEQPQAKPFDKSNVLEFTLDDFSKPAPEQKPDLAHIDDSLGLGELMPTPNKKK